MGGLYFYGELEDLDAVCLLMKDGEYVGTLTHLQNILN